MIPVFTRDIISEGSNITFRFTRTYTVLGVLFFIQMVDKNFVICKFKMSIERGKWKVISEVPDGIMDLESQLSDAIDSTNPL